MATYSIEIIGLLQEIALFGFDGHFSFSAVFVTLLFLFFKK